jgi:RNA polymerase sigma factor (sigma-70 family)
MVRVPPEKDGRKMIWANKSGGSPERSYRTLSILACQGPWVVPGLDGGAMPNSDQEVVSRYLQGDSAAVNTVDSWISRAAWPYQRRLSSRWEDVLQDVRLEVTRLLGQGKFRGESSLRTYLWQVVSHTCLDQLRSQGRWQWTDLEEIDESRTALPAASGGRHEDRDLVQRVLERVSGECRELWRLIVLGHSYREMSQRLGVAEGTLRVRVLRCREKAVAARAELLGPGIASRA